MMNVFKAFFAAVIIFLFGSQNSFGQTTQDAEALRGLIYAEPKPGQVKISTADENIENYFFTQLLFLYREYISSQDGPGCTFYPSCSGYALQAIKKEGVILGVIDALDRINRCNGLSPENYERHIHSGKLYDPVK